MYPFRTHTPIRTYTISHPNYKTYLEPLRNDFSKRCWYCNIPDVFYGWIKEFHIDHFKPKKNKSFPAFSSLTNEYTNLVYSCPSCNRYKGNTWSASEPNWIDPIEPIYWQLFFKEKSFLLWYDHTNANARYIYLKLRLFWRRKQYQYLIDELLTLINRLKEKQEITPNQEILNLIYQLQDFKELVFNELCDH